MLETVRSERGATLILVLALAAITSLLAMSLLFTTDIDFRTSKNYQDRTEALNHTDTAISEVLWRMTLATDATAMPGGSTIDVNGMTGYEAAIPYDPLGLLSNGTDDDGDGDTDEPDELNLGYAWTTRIVMSTTDPSPGAPWEETDSDPTTGPPYGSTFVEPTIQPQATWRTYSVADHTSDEALTIRFKLDTDTVVGDSEGDGAEIVFYDEDLVTNGTDDFNTLTGLGGDADATNDSPYNITWSDGITTYPATGLPVILITAAGRVERRGETVATREVEVEAVHKITFRDVATKAICTCSDLALSGPTDSFKSSEGAYGSGPIYDNGDIGSNARIDLSGGGLVNGNSESGDETKLSGLIMKDAWAGAAIVTTAEVVGTSHEWEVPIPQPCDCNAFNLNPLLAAAAASNVNASGILPDGDHPYYHGTNVVNTSKSIWKNPLELDLGSSMMIIMTGGTYYLTDLKMSGSDVLIQIGLDTDSDGWVDAPPTEPVKIYMENPGDVDLSSHGIANFGDPVDLQIYIKSDAEAFSMSGGFTFRGFVYNPLDDCDMSGSSQFEGAMICGSFSGGGDGVHFDEDLAVLLIAPRDDGIRLLAWTEVD